MQKKTPLVVPFCLIPLLLSVSAGCEPSQSGSSPDTQPPAAQATPVAPSAEEIQAAQAYANAYKALMREYRDTMQKLEARPLPPHSSSAKDNRNLVADQANAITVATEGFLKRLDALSPPAELQELHSATRNFFRISAEGNRRWTEAIRTGDRKARDKAYQEMTSSVALASDTMAKAVEKIEGKALN